MELLHHLQAVYSPYVDCLYYGFVSLIMSSYGTDMSAYMVAINNLCYGSCSDKRT